MGHPPQIPLTPQTDERMFPRWADKAPPGRSGARFPRMLTEAATAEHRKAWLEKNRKTDRTTREDYWEERPPKVGDQIPVLSTQDLVDAGLAMNINEPIVADSEEDLERILEVMGIELPAEPETIDVQMRASASQLAEIRKTNAALEAELAKRQKLQAKLAERDEEGEEPAPRRGRKPKRMFAAKKADQKSVTGRVKAMSLAQMTAAAADEG